jgi:NodT family efflux transporter outer membrane factor (OMF) lipoprotein
VEPDLAIDVPATWEADSVAAIDSTGIDSLRAAMSMSNWWTTFADSTLDTLVKSALERNHDLKAASARVQAALAQAKIAGADLYPHFNLVGTARRQKQNFIGLPLPGGEDQVRSTTANTYGVSLESSWEIDLWGRIRAGQSAALAGAEGAQAAVAATRLSLAAQTAKAWYAITEARLQVELADATVASFAQGARYVRDRYERGLRSPLELRLALGDLAAAEAARDALRLALNRSARQMEILLGNYPHAVLDGAGTLPPVPGPVPLGLPAALVARRPDLVVAERQAAAAGARVKEARRAFYPRVSLTAIGGVTSAALKDIVDGDFAVWSLAGCLAQPLFQGGRLKGQLSLAEARMVEALELYAQDVLTAYGEVELALTAEEFLAEREVNLEDAVTHSEAARLLAEQQYDAGIVDIITVLDSRRRSIQRQSELLTVRRERLDNRINLHLALGGGFDVTDIMLHPPDEPTDDQMSTTGEPDDATTTSPEDANS